MKYFESERLNILPSSDSNFYEFNRPEKITHDGKASYDTNHLHMIENVFSKIIKFIKGRKIHFSLRVFSIE